MIYRIALFFSCAVVLAAAPHAQPGALLQGTVTYDVIEQLPPPVLPPGLEGVAASIPTEMRVTRRLRFQGETALTDKVATVSEGMVAPATVYYVDHTSGRRVTQYSLSGEAFLVEEPAQPIQWQVTGEESEFLGYPMLRATAAIYDKEVEAWFTPAIPVPIGPDYYYGLPGLILVLTVDAGQKTIQATDVSLEPLTEPIAPPTKGRTVSAEEYGQIVQERAGAAQRALRESLEDDD